MASLKERSVKIRDDKDLNAKNLERMVSDYDRNFRQLDKRRIAQETTLDTGASLSDTITKLNTLLAALNASDLTEE